MREFINSVFVGLFAALFLFVLMPLGTVIDLVLRVFYFFYDRAKPFVCNDLEQWKNTGMGSRIFYMVVVIFVWVCVILLLKVLN